MEITIENRQDVKIAKLIGDVDTNTSSEITKTLSALIEPGSKILLDMEKVEYMSSAGLRMLLSLFRQTEAQSGKLILAGLSEDLSDIMSVTGFLDFFTTSNTVEEGLKLF